MKDNFWLLITGTGRCGTGYLARVLNSVGVKCSHEGLFNRDEQDETLRRVRERLDNAWWGWEVESSWLAAPHLWLPELKDVKVVHLVRNPKNVIDSQIRLRSFQNEKDLFYQWQLTQIPMLEHVDPELRPIYFYIYWNSLIEPYAHIRWKVEDNVLDLLSLLGIDYSDKEVFSQTNYNSRAGYQKSDIDFETVPEPLRSTLYEMSYKYGY